MSGFITLSEVIACEKMIVEMWGQGFFDACVKAGLDTTRQTTFLGLLAEFGLI